MKKAIVLNNIQTNNKATEFRIKSMRPSLKTKRKSKTRIKDKSKITIKDTTQI